MATYDALIVGSGINSLVCAALLGKKGKRVIVLERNSEPGGCIRTEELFPGYRHDILSSWFPLFVAGPGYGELAADLHARGLEFANTFLPTGVVTPDGQSLVLTTNPEATSEALGKLGPGEGEAFQRILQDVFTQDADLVFGVLGGELRSWKVARLLGRELVTRRLTGAFQFAGLALESCRTWLQRDFESSLVHALIAPWVLHAGLGPDDAFSGLMGKIIIATVAAGGLPVPVGGARAVVDAFVSLISDTGGEIVTNTNVERVTVEAGSATGVVTSDGRQYRADNVVCNVTPQALYGTLLAPEHVPDDVVASAASYRYGRADMQIHYALDAPPEWGIDDLRRTAMVHLTPGLDGVSRAVNEAERGLLPAEATIVVGQPTVLDPSRAPAGGSILWIQLQELPNDIVGDAAEEIDTPADGMWNDRVAEAYADRIHARLTKYIPNLDQALVGRRVFSPADLESLNPNLVGGDPYSGACSLDQFLWWRPTAATKNHSTPVKNLFHIGASTHPGPGLGGNSGYLVAQRI